VRCRGSVTPLTHKSHIRSYAVQGFARGNRLKDYDKDFLDEPRVDISPRCFPQRRTRHKPGSPTSHGSTYIEIHISPPCSNPRSAPPPRRGVFCCGAKSEVLHQIGGPDSQADAPVDAPVARGTRKTRPARRFRWRFGHAKRRALPAALYKKSGPLHGPLLKWVVAKGTLPLLARVAPVQLLTLLVQVNVTM
jgi:hypothetical protein